MRDDLAFCTATVPHMTPPCLIFAVCDTEAVEVMLYSYILQLKEMRYALLMLRRRTKDSSNSNYACAPTHLVSSSASGQSGQSCVYCPS